MSQPLSIPETFGIIGVIWLCAYGIKCFTRDWLEPRLLRFAAWAGKAYRTRKP